MLRVVISLMLFFGMDAYADLKCDVDLNYGLVVNKTQIRVLDESRTIFQINNAEQLIVKGEWITLKPEQQEQLKELACGLHYVVPKMIVLATEGVELAVVTVEHVYSGLVGQDHKSMEKLESSLERVQKRIREKFIHAGDNFYIGPGSLENVDELVDRELEEQIEQALNTSLGGVLSAIGGLASNGDEETEKRMEELTQRLENVGQEIERNVAPKADSLRQKARWFCNKIHQLDKVEENLRASVPELQKYDVILTHEKHTKRH